MSEDLLRARKIVICLDGTGNEIKAGLTNVLRIYQGLDTAARPGGLRPQVALYQPGVGTRQDPKLAVNKAFQAWRGLRGQMSGLGLEDDVLDAYRWLCTQYTTAAEKALAYRDWRARVRAEALATGRDKAELDAAFPEIRARDIQGEDDHVWILGFSRGAYAARILAGFLHNFGRLAPEQMVVLTKAYRAYARIVSHPPGTDPEAVFGDLRRFADVLKVPPVPVRGLGLFDTVSSMIRFAPGSLPRTGAVVDYATHPSVRSNESVRIVAHALALDERRCMFRALPWDMGKPFWGNRFRNGTMRSQFVRQSWFAGYHSDIGGSSDEGETGLGKITLAWLLDNLAEMDRAAWEEDVAKGLIPALPDGSARPEPPFGLILRQGFRKTIDALGTPGADGKTPADHIATEAPVHDSMKILPIWPVAEWIPQSASRMEWPRRRFWKWYIPASEPRPVPEGHLVHPSVRARIAAGGYDPVNLPETT